MIDPSMFLKVVDAVEKQGGKTKPLSWWIIGGIFLGTIAVVVLLGALL
jgi:hypothetical protein